MWRLPSRGRYAAIEQLCYSKARLTSTLSQHCFPGNCDVVYRVCEEEAGGRVAIKEELLKWLSGGVGAELCPDNGKQACEEPAKFGITTTRRDKGRGEGVDHWLQNYGWCAPPPALRPCSARPARPAAPPRRHLALHRSRPIGSQALRRLLREPRPLLRVRRAAARRRPFTDGGAAAAAQP
jgi:hypothetical protein